MILTLLVALKPKTVLSEKEIRTNPETILKAVLYEAPKVPDFPVWEYKFEWPEPQPVMPSGDALGILIQKESGGNPLAVNGSSLACGIPQSLPCVKLIAYAGLDPKNYDLTTVSGVREALKEIPTEIQVSWMTLYIQNRYGTAENALQFHLRNGWY